MNKNFALYLLGTKVQDFLASSMSFTFLLVIYQISNSALYSGFLTATTVAGSRILMFYLVPVCKPFSPFKVVSSMSFTVTVVSLLAVLGSLFWGDSILFYFVCSILFAILQEMRTSFASSIIPRLVDKEYLFKANSVSSIFLNVSMILAPLVSYLFTARNISVFFVFYAAVSCGGGLLVRYLTRLTGDERPEAPAAPAKKKMKFFSDHWVVTIRMIGGNQTILYCISIGVLINIVFAGINGPFLLKEGHGSLGSTLIKICLSGGSLLGVYGAYALKVKEHYKRYLNISIAGIVLALLVPVFVENLYVLLVCMVFLTLFVMFMMNTTGTLLQLATPLPELPAVYEIRSTLYAVVVPLSYIVIGWVLERWGYKPYFLAGAVLLFVCSFAVRRKTGTPTPETAAL
ncbi:MFS transporter [Tumebacillus flagellatus]|uniref:Major facilitator superfamily (MFS) profile domain-containing protein n=1 Tax=Tumebacillus flagellatus TaxID=1157490 RepID=A0A074MAT3_9BACL|nr:MFS transporter [Tumebacillus flagellatus]KEO83027.1 hypothetical protein EL26_12110 [Tumebacillus flagellatus]